jgi:hypothetical protein
MENMSVINEEISNEPVVILLLTTNNISKIEKLKKRTCELLEVSTVHGIPNIVRSKSLLILIMWFLLTIISASVGSYAWGGKSIYIIRIIIIKRNNSYLIHISYYGNNYINRNIVI